MLEFSPKSVSSSFQNLKMFGFTRPGGESNYIMSRVVRKPAFCICQNKEADQLRDNREADQRLCFRYIDSTISLLPLIQNFKPLAILCGCTARFVWDLVRNHEDQFSQNEALIIQSASLSKTACHACAACYIHRLIKPIMSLCP